MAGKVDRGLWLHDRALLHQAQLISKNPNLSSSSSSSSTLLIRIEEVVADAGLMLFSNPSSFNNLNSLSSSCNNEASTSLHNQRITLEKKKKKLIWSWKTYDRESIVKRLQDRDRTCPHTLLDIEEIVMIPNLLIKDMIMVWRSRNVGEPFDFSKDEELTEPKRRNLVSF
ncbi:hypothetical protein L1987_59758 [Smallanthus sonchifolius]|uniref:Uncharacterized protein n=1 Tax=Smallanthus sonchifolius TaxID=185202 RepID=A0ACB9D6I8_9ASTR|nr:hypothetical protein L1987_59758 [Smallanthus sonchifolius]